jgi:thioredoxin-like negative regulator of GroEL
VDATYLAEKFAAARVYDRYVQTGTPEQQARWARVYEAARLTADQAALVAGFVRQMKVLIVSGVWCGDCIEQVPLLQRIAEANPQRIALRLLDRDEHKDLSGRLRINGGDRVPVVLLLAEDDELCSTYGDRPLSRYRALAARQLGPSCPTGIVPPAGDELAATLADWLAEVERVQLMLRLSGRLRKKYGD